MADIKKTSGNINLAKEEKGEVREHIDMLFFSKENYMWMAIGAALILIGMFLMSGGKNEDPNTFDYDVVYSTTRITIAPILIVLGLLTEIYAIFKKPSSKYYNQ